MRIFIFIFAIFACLPAFSQKKGQAEVDSLRQALAEAPKQPSRKRAHILNTLGKAYLNTSDYVNSHACFFESLAIADKINDEELRAATYRDMSVVYFYQHNYDGADDCDRKALAFYKKVNDSVNQALTLKSMGDTYLEKGDSANATNCYGAALPIFQKLQDREDEAAVYSNQAILQNTNYQTKIELGLAAKKLFDQERPDNVLPAINTGNLGVAYLDIVRYDTLHRTRPSALIPADRKKLLEIAEKYLKEAMVMSKSNNDIGNSAYFTGVLAELEEQKGDFRNAYYNFRKYQTITDSIFSQENKNKIAALENQRAIDRKNREIENKELQIGNQHKKMWLLASCIAFLAATGGLVYRQSLSRKKTNRTLLLLNSELDEANKIKAKFFGILSHDLRSPLANLINFLQLQKRKPGLLSEQEFSDRENRITQSAKSLLDTMETMLLWSKGQMEHFRPETGPVPVKELFAQLQKLFAGELEVKIRYVFDDSLVLNTDENYLQTILQNLTANSIKALRQTPQAEICWQAWKQDDKTYLSITDNGPGIRKEELRALYDEKASRGSKNGLGLHIIRDLAKAIGCSINFRPATGSGAEFIIAI